MSNIGTPMQPAFTPGSYGPRDWLPFGVEEKACQKALDELTINIVGPAYKAIRVFRRELWENEGIWHPVETLHRLIKAGLVNTPSKPELPGIPYHSPKCDPFYQTRDEPLTDADPK